VIAPARRALGSSGIQVSELSLGSWRTYERKPREAGEAVLRKAREVGINFLDDARYNDETGTAPMKSGYSEVVFGELFRASGWKRAEVVLANKLWWEFWPEQSAEAELDGSLERMDMDYLDLVYAEKPPEGLSVDQIVHDIAALIAAAQGAAPPCAAQLAYSLIRRSPVEDADMIDALGAAGASVVASFTLNGGALTGKYRTPDAHGRLIGELDHEMHQRALRASDDLRLLAESMDARPSALAIAFALLKPNVASVLFGSTTPDQVAENVSAVELRSKMDEQTVARLRQIGREQS
jgi:aryl-alcohol dehydrogenase-like predicted oxidoreductase